MKQIKGVGQWAARTGKHRPLYLALGNFDGVHRGHQTIINRAVALAGKTGGVCAALVFDPHPARLLCSGNKLSYLSSLEQKASLMERLGLDFLLIEPFTAALSSLAPELFVKHVLLGKLEVEVVVVGSDYSFGRGGRGRAETLAGLGAKNGFAVDICPLLFQGGVPVSSSLIRSLVREGRVREASTLLNYYFFRSGKVVTGRGIGQKLLFPTANITVDPDLLWPGPGVYLTAVEGIGTAEPLFGVTNVGARPTFKEAGMAVETHVIDFNGSLYDRVLKIYFLEKLRETAVFSGPEALRARILADINRAKELVAVQYRSLQTCFFTSCAATSRAHGAPKDSVLPPS